MTLSKIILLCLLGCFTQATLAQDNQPQYKLPKGWYRAGSDPAKYTMGLDEGGGRNGSNAGTIRSLKKKINGFGTLMQVSTPDSFQGERIRMTGYLKTSNVSGWTGFWLRVDKSDGSRKSSAFDNMHDRSVTGTTAWKHYVIVLDVAEGTRQIAYGVLLSGTGQVWFDDINFEIVDKTVPITGTGEHGVANTDFEE